MPIRMPAASASSRSSRPTPWTWNPQPVRSAPPCVRDDAVVVERSPPGREVAGLLQESRVEARRRSGPRHVRPRTPISAAFSPASMPHPRRPAGLKSDRNRSSRSEHHALEQRRLVRHQAIQRLRRRRRRARATAPGRRSPRHPLAAEIGAARPRSMIRRVSTSVGAVGGTPAGRAACGRSCSAMSSTPRLVILDRQSRTSGIDLRNCQVS